MNNNGGPNWSFVWWICVAVGAFYLALTVLDLLLQAAVMVYGG